MTEEKLTTRRIRENDPQFLLLLRDHEERWDTFSPAEIERVIGMFMAWNRRLTDEERFVGAGKLTSELGTTVRARGTDTYIDGPYAEAKEAIAGYFQIRAIDLADATEAARGCPILTYGGSVEVRPLVHRADD